MYITYKFNKSECEEIIPVIEKALYIWIKDLPPQFRGMMIGRFEEIIEKTFIDDEKEGWIDSEFAIENLIIPAVMTVCDLKNEKLKNLLEKFVSDLDGSTLYDALKSKIRQKERNEKLKKSYKTKEQAIADGIENPLKYNCWECGKTFWAKWRSNYSPAAVCPVCETENR